MLRALPAVGLLEKAPEPDTTPARVDHVSVFEAVLVILGASAGTNVASEVPELKL